MSETTILIVCIACFSLITAIFIATLVRTHLALQAAWVAIKSLEAHNNMMFEFLEAERERQRTTISPQ